MSKNSIRIKSETEYIIEVNDKGETISFDLRDTSLYAKLSSMFDEVNKLISKTEKKEKEINAREDAPYRGVEGATITQNEYDMLKLFDDFYKEQRKVIDGFMGEGACQKIFGDKNYHGMLDDLMVALEPHFKKMGMNTQTIMKKTSEKYLNRQQRRALK